MFSGVGFQQQWLLARCVLGVSPSRSSSSRSSSRHGAARRNGSIAERFCGGLKTSRNPVEQGACDGGGGSIGDGLGVWFRGKLQRQQQRRFGGCRCAAEEFAPRAAHGHLPRQLSAVSGRAPRLAPSAATLTDDIKTEKKGALQDFIFDGSRTTTVAHKVWQGVVRAGDTVIDATCGNGVDTLMLAKLVLQDGTSGSVTGMDLQQSALDKTSALLDRELNSSQRDKVSLLQLCHSQLDKVVGESSVRLVAFNLGYQPGGDRSMITQADTTVRALGAAVNVLEPGGLISILSYVGHPGGREEYDAVKEFAAGLPPEEWVCSHLEWVNRPLCPHLMFLMKK